MAEKEKAEEKKESRFPMVFDTCRVCGCTETIAQVAWNEQAEKGRVKKDTPVATQQIQVPLMDPANPPKILGGLTGVLYPHIDYCAECGTGRATRVKVLEANVQMMSPGGPGGAGGMLPKGYG